MSLDRFTIIFVIAANDASLQPCYTPDNKSIVSPKSTLGNASLGVEELVFDDVKKEADHERPRKKS